MADLRCRTWRAEALLRLLENNLELAENPDELIVYAAHAKAARDHASLAAIVTALERLEERHDQLDAGRAGRQREDVIAVLALARPADVV